MGLVEFTFKILCNAASVAVGFWVVNDLMAIDADPTLAFGFWTGMVTAHVTYFGYTKGHLKKEKPGDMMSFEVSSTGQVGIWRGGYFITDDPEIVVERLNMARNNHEI